MPDKDDLIKELSLRGHKPEVARAIVENMEEDDLLRDVLLLMDRLSLASELVDILEGKDQELAKAYRKAFNACSLRFRKFLDRISSDRFYTTRVLDRSVVVSSISRYREELSSLLSRTEDVLGEVSKKLLELINSRAGKLLDELAYALGELNRAGIRSSSLHSSIRSMSRRIKLLMKLGSSGLDQIPRVARELEQLERKIDELKREVESAISKAEELSSLVGQLRPMIEEVRELRQRCLDRGVSPRFSEDLAEEDLIDHLEIEGGGAIELLRTVMEKAERALSGLRTTISFLEERERIRSSLKELNERPLELPDSILSMFPLAVREAEEEVLDRLSEIAKEIDKVDSYWSAYESSASRILKEWDELRREALRILASVDSTIKVHREELQELEVKKELGLIDEELYEKATSSINERLRRCEELKNRIVEMLDSIESRSAPHYQRLKIATARPDIGRLKLSLMKLEELYNTGKIDRAVYEKIKSEVEAEIKRLERLLG